MSSYAQLTSMLPSDSTLTAGQIAAMDHFDDTLKFCLSNWYNDKTSLVLSDNVQDLYGLALSNYFQHSLEVCVGGAVALTTVDDSNAQKTVVHMPKRNHPQPSPQVQPDMSSTTETSERNVVNLPATHVGKKKVPHVPRPMNSWMHFRDEKHKELKAENPTISVQEISSLCSQIWRDFTDEQKLPYKLAAEAGAQELMKKHPNYKYSPRKPGEKKKRQSRKAKQAAAASAPQTFNIASVPEVRLTAFDTSIDFATAPEVSTASAQAMFTIDLGEFTGPMPFFGSDEAGLPIASQLYDVESLRHDRLHSEFDSALDAHNTFELFAGDAFAFRAGADGNATLPSITFDDY